jgi:hypothetical protein
MQETRELHSHDLNSSVQRDRASSYSWSIHGEGVTSVNRPPWSLLHDGTFIVKVELSNHPHPWYALETDRPHGAINATSPSRPTDVTPGCILALLLGQALWLTKRDTHHKPRHGPTAARIRPCQSHP